jgi:hypothetical protein
MPPSVPLKPARKVKPGTIIPPHPGVPFLRSNYDLEASRLAKWDKPDKHGRLKVTIWRATIGGRDYDLVINGDHRLHVAITRGVKPIYHGPTPEFFHAARRLGHEALAASWNDNGWIDMATGEHVHLAAKV